MAEGELGPSERLAAQRDVAAGERSMGECEGGDAMEQGGDGLVELVERLGAQQDPVGVSGVHGQQLVDDLEGKPGLAATKLDPGEGQLDRHRGPQPIESVSIPEGGLVQSVAGLVERAPLENQGWRDGVFQRRVEVGARSFETICASMDARPRGEGLALLRSIGGALEVLVVRLEPGLVTSSGDEGLGPDAVGLDRIGIDLRDAPRLHEGIAGVACPKELVGDADPEVHVIGRGLDARRELLQAGVLPWVCHRGTGRGEHQGCREQHRAQPPAHHLTVPRLPRWAQVGLP